MEYILHSEMSKASREFVEKNDLSGFKVILWESESGAYLAKGLPSPASFPSAVILTPSVEVTPEEGDPYAIPATLVVIPDPESVIDIEVKRQAIIARKQSGEFLGQPVQPIPDADSFNSSVYSAEVFSRYPEVIPFALEMASALDLLRRSGTPENIGLVQICWMSLKLKLPQDYIQFVEEKAAQYNIPIVGAK